MEYVLAANPDSGYVIVTSESTMIQVILHIMTLAILAGVIVVSIYLVFLLIKYLKRRTQYYEMKLENEKGKNLQEKNLN